MLHRKQFTEKTCEDVQDNTQNHWKKHGLNVGKYYIHINVTYVMNKFNELMSKNYHVIFKIILKCKNATFCTPTPLL